MLDWLRSGSEGHGSLRPSQAHTDARRVVVPMRGRTLDPEIARRARLKRGAAILFLGALFVTGAAAALVGDRGWLALSRKQEELARLVVEVEQLRAEVGTLERSIERLESEPSAFERVARERLDMAKPGEIVFLLPPAGELSGHDEKVRVEP